MLPSMHTHAAEAGGPVGTCACNPHACQAAWPDKRSGELNQHSLVVRLLEDLLANPCLNTLLNLVRGGQG